MLPFSKRTSKPKVCLSQSVIEAQWKRPISAGWVRTRGHVRAVALKPASIQITWLDLNHQLRNGSSPCPLFQPLLNHLRGPGKFLARAPTSRRPLAFRSCEICNLFPPQLFISHPGKRDERRVLVLDPVPGARSLKCEWER